MGLVQVELLDDFFEPFKRGIGPDELSGPRSLPCTVHFRPVPRNLVVGGQDEGIHGGRGTTKMLEHGLEMLRFDGVEASNQPRRLVRQNSWRHGLGDGLHGRHITLQCGQKVEQIVL